MRHFRSISRVPHVAQFEPVLQFISVIQAALGVIATLVQTLGIFGIDPPQKGASAGE
jgi:hypothetical protein